VAIAKDVGRKIIEGTLEAMARAPRESKKSVTYCSSKRGAFGDPGVGMGMDMAKTIAGRAIVGNAGQRRWDEEKGQRFDGKTTVVV
jgi:hypothetical protein